MIEIVIVLMGLWIAYLLRKVGRLQKELNAECSAELAEMQEYARYLEEQLNQNHMGRLDK